MKGKNDANLQAVFGGEAVPQHSRLPERKIKPWHKPRKQFIRRYQWLKEIESICDNINFRDSRPLRYLSLPGEDLLDVRVVQECCARRGIKLKFLGLNDDYSSDKPNTWLHIACNEITGMQSVHRDSTVIQDRFEQIADRSSKAFHYVSKYGPFDVVNLDLCSSISPLRTDQWNYYGALQAIADQQVVMRPPNEPWLLLVTSRVGGPWVADGDLKKLGDCVSANINAYGDFAAQLEAIAPGSSAVAARRDGSWAELLQPHFVNLFSVAVGKWVLALLSTAKPRWGVRLLDSYAYKVKADSPDMVSLAFRMDGYAELPRDTFGLSGAVAPTASYDERRFALGLIDGVRGIADVDVRLKQDRKLYAKMEQETADLLASARYEESSVQRALRDFRSRM
jgi:hypothetical protein